MAKKDSIAEVDKILGLPKARERQPPQHSKAIIDEAEMIIAQLEELYPEKFDFATEREACVRLGARSVIYYIKNTYLKDRVKE